MNWKTCGNQVQKDQQFIKQLNHITMTESGQDDPEWCSFECKSGEILFYYNKTTGEHRWPGGNNEECNCSTTKDRKLSPSSQETHFKENQEISSMERDSSHIVEHESTDDVNGSKDVQDNEDVFDERLGTSKYSSCLDKRSLPSTQEISSIEQDTQIVEHESRDDDDADGGGDGDDDGGGGDGGGDSRDDQDNKNVFDERLEKKGLGRKSDERRHKCNHCGKMFRRPCLLKAHQYVHTGVKPYKCSDCNKGFANKSALRIHGRIHTGVKPYKCTHCSKGFAYQGDLKTHERIHTGLKSNKCSYCSKGFTQQSALKRHERIHTGVKPYKCTYCSKAFTNQSVLRTHERIHTGVKPYKCTHCSKEFTNRSNLKRHEVIHTGVKAYKCPQCSKGFTDKSHLKRHERIHKGSNHNIQVFTL